MPVPKAPGVRSARARVARLTQDRRPDDPQLVAARRQLEVEKLAEHIAAVVDAAPPLNDDQKDRLRVLLGGAQ